MQNSEKSLLLRKALDTRHWHDIGPQACFEPRLTPAQSLAQLLTQFPFSSPVPSFSSSEKHPASFHGLCYLIDVEGGDQLNAPCRTGEEAEASRPGQDNGNDLEAPQANKTTPRHQHIRDLRKYQLISSHSP